jgi:hypothetical protein
MISLTKITFCGAAFFALIGYLAIPLVAGYFAWGPDKRGVRLYPVRLHVDLYSIGYSIEHDNKPRVRADGNVDRPWTYTIK